MSQRDLVAELRAARITAPDEVRERVRLVAARDTTPRRRTFTWRRALVVALPAAAAIAAAVVFTRPASHTQQNADVLRSAQVGTAPAIAHGAATKEFAPIPSRSRVQDVNASLSLRLRDVSDAVKRVQRITTSLGGYPLSIVASSHGRAARADIVVKVPRLRVAEAIRRFAALGTITAEDVRVQDLQGGLDATDRTIARLQRELAELRRQPPNDAVQARIVAHVLRIQRLQRQEAQIRRTAHYATIDIHLATPAVEAAPHEHGPWHALRLAFRWAGIGAIYVLALGAPLALLVAAVVFGVRLLRRRREDALLSRP